MIPLYNTIQKGINCHMSATLEKTGIIIVTILVLVFLIHRLVLKPINELEGKSRELFYGNLNTRMALHTNDELKKLGKSFNLMTQRLMHSRNSLEKKVTKAVRDLTHANHELLKLDKLKSDFFASMSHELRKPLNHNHSDSKRLVVR